MQIHELNNFNGTPGSTNYLAIDNGSDTSRISGTDLLAPANARIDNVVLQNKSESVNLFAGSISKGGGTYSLSESAANFDFLEFVFNFNGATVQTARVRPNADILISVPGFNATNSPSEVDITRLSVSINGANFTVAQAYNWSWNGESSANSYTTPAWAWADSLAIEVYGIRYAQLDSTEVTDLRTAHDGTVYPTARAAREADYNALDSKIGAETLARESEVSGLKKAIITEVALTTSDIFNGLVNGDDGVFNENDDYRRTGYIPLDSAIWGLYAYVNCTFVGASGVAFYDRGKNFLRGYTYDTRPTGGRWGLNTKLQVQIPQNAYYIATSIAAADYSDPSDFLIAFASVNSNEQINIKNKIDDIDDINKNIVNGNPINIINNQIIWTLGGLNTSGEETTAARRLRSNFVDISAFPILKIGIDPDYYLALHFYDANKTHLYDTGWLSVDSLINIPVGSKYVRILIRNDTAISLDSYEHISVLYYYEYAKDIDILEGVVWELGTISGGTNVDTSYRIRTRTYIPIKTIKSLDIKISNGYEFGYTFYTSNRTIISDGAYFGNYLHLEVPENAYFVRFIIRNLYSNAGTITWANNMSCTGNPELMNKINKLLSDANGQGDRQYTGSKIILKDRTDQVNKCQITVWKDFKGSEISNINDYRFRLNQSMAMYGGYLFLLEETGLCVVIDYATKNIVSTFELPVSNENHYNSAMFTDIFYDDNDEFPLLISSRCGNLYDKTTDLNEALLSRIQRNGTTFTCTLINSIKSDIQGFSSDWCVDNNDRTITFIVYTNGTFLENENNPVKFFTWKLPKASELISGNTITLLKNDLIAKAECEHLIFQGATIVHNIIYIGMQPTSGGRYIYGVDVKKGMVTSIVPLVSAREIEGVAVYNGKMYVSQKDGEDTAGVNPLTIYELAF